VIGVGVASGSTMVAANVRYGRPDLEPVSGCRFGRDSTRAPDDHRRVRRDEGGGGWTRPGGRILINGRHSRPPSQRRS